MRGAPARPRGSSRPGVLHSALGRNDPSREHAAGGAVTRRAGGPSSPDAPQARRRGSAYSRRNSTSRRTPKPVPPFGRYGRLSPMKAGPAMSTWIHG